jgi:hypothetical protein
VIAACVTAAAFAPVPSFAQQTIAQQTSSQQTSSQQTAGNSENAAARPGWNLRWRKSERVTPDPVQVPRHDVFAATASSANGNPSAHRQPTSPGRTTTASPAREPLPVIRRRTPAAESRSSNELQFRTPNLQASSPHGTPRTNQLRTPAGPESVPSVSAGRNALQPTRHSVRQVSAAATTRQAGMIRRTGHNEPVGNYRREPTQLNGPNPDDFFNNPFADSVRADSVRVAQTPAEAQTPNSQTPNSQTPNSRASQAPNQGLSVPPATPDRTAPNAPATESLPQNALREKAMQLPGETESGNPAFQLPAPGNGEEDGPSMRDLFRDSEPPVEESSPKANNAGESVSGERASQPLPAPTQDRAQAREDRTRTLPDEKPSPSDRNVGGGAKSLDEYMDENPFDDQSQGTSGKPAGEPAAQPGQPSATSTLSPSRLSCQDFRNRIRDETIDTISLDISPPFRPDLFDPEDYQKQRQKFEARQSQRDWTTIEGVVLARGKLVDLAYENVVIETESGETRRLPMDRLSEGDLGYLADNWGLPKECLIEQVDYQPRAWTALTMTWKASNLCSKPRYFEEVNLERYGHTAGPWLQPVVSSAHFFANIAVTPYKMGIHPPNECQYALGYYRPGNCAPWILPPVPISARGALLQAGVMSGAIGLIP